MIQIQPIRGWARDSVAHIPADWAQSLIIEWQQRARPTPIYDFRFKCINPSIEKTRADGNIWLNETLDEINSGPANLLGCSDSDIIEEAKKAERYCMELRRIYKSETAAYDAMRKYAAKRGITERPRGELLSIRIKRFTCSLYWRRQLRKVASRITEHAAQKLGRVSRLSGCYASHVAVRRRQEQIARNDKILESIKMFSSESNGKIDDGVCTNLKQIAEHTLANKTIRRGELMMRARGFEEVAADLGHAAIFVTLTCPSRFHAMRIGKSGTVEKNPNWDKSTPREAQAYLTKTWACIRAALARRGRVLYGIRVAEPHHDGCPHWHMLLFAPEGPDEQSELGIHDIMQIFYEYALRDTPEEPGAWKRRIDFVRIQPESGSAAGYIAKYLAKNLDGAHIEGDLFGNPALVAAQRVDAWASTWGIRQFQQLGGAPVGVWRELRRCKIADLDEDAPEHLRQALIATSNEKWLAKAGIDLIGARASFAEYLMAQGGPTIGRKARIGIWKVKNDGIGRYGDKLTDRIVGVKTAGKVMEQFGIIKQWPVLKEFFLQSARKIFVQYKKFDIVSLMGYVSRIAASRLIPGGSKNEDRPENKVRALPHHGETGSGICPGGGMG